MNIQELLCAGMALALLQALSPAPASAEDLLLRNARVLDYATTERPDQTPVVAVDLLIRDGAVVERGADLGAADGIRVEDLSGAFVTPGLIDSVSQLGLVEISMVANSNDARVSDFPMGPGFDVQYALNSRSQLFPVARWAGVTRSIVAPQTGVDPLAGFGAAVSTLAGGPALMKAQIALFGDIGTTGAGFTGGSRAALLVRLRASLAAARRFNAGQTHSEPGEYSRSDLLALKSWLASRTPLALHVNQASQIEQALALARDFRLPLIVLGGAEAWRVAPALAAAEVPVVLEPMANLPAGFDRLGARLDNAALLHRAGVRIALSAGETHNPPWLRQGAGVAAANGLPYGAALDAITRAPAEIWRLDRLGVLEPGARADLVVWSGDPLEVMSHAQRVMSDGVWQPTATRAERLRERYRDLSDQAVPFGFR